MDLPEDLSYQDVVKMAQDRKLWKILSGNLGQLDTPAIRKCIKDHDKQSAISKKMTDTPPSQTTTTPTQTANTNPTPAKTNTTTPTAKLTRRQQIRQLYLKRKLQRATTTATTTNTQTNTPTPQTTPTTTTATPPTIPITDGNLRSNAASATYQAMMMDNEAPALPQPTLQRKRQKKWSQPRRNPRRTTRKDKVEPEPSVSTPLAPIPLSLSLSPITCIIPEITQLYEN